MRNRDTTSEETLAAFDLYKERFAAFFDRYAADFPRWQHRNPGYRESIRQSWLHYVEPGARVLEIGSGTGDLLSALEPSHGVGIDLSAGMVRLAAARHPHLSFVHMAAEELDLHGERFDYIVLSDVLGFVYDLRRAFERLRAVCRPHTRLVMHWYSRLWHPLFELAERAGLKYPQPQLNWTTVPDIENLLRLAGFEVVTHRPRILMPFKVPGLATAANRYLANVPGFRWLCLTDWIVARPIDLPDRPRRLSVSVISPCRNEAGNIDALVRRLPPLGDDAELIFVEGHSTDDTLAECRRVAARSGRRVTVLVQEGRGKGDAVRRGFAEANGDVLMILDADLSVAPEDLGQFYDVLLSGRAEFVNGSRLVYDIDRRAMRFLNLLGNKTFARLLSGIMGQPVKDSLCGTKVLLRRDYERIAANRGHFGDLDPFGDFDLLLGAAKLNLRIADLPVRYHPRHYGETNISRFAHGLLLLRMTARAARRLLFVP